MDWTELVAADPDGTFFHTPRYLKVYWEELCRGTLEIALVRDGDDLVAAAAFEIADGVLTFLGGSEVTDYMGPVALPGARERAAKGLAGALASRDDWGKADLSGLLAEGAWAPALSAAADDVGFATLVDGDGAAPFLELPGTYDEYLASLSAKRRHEIRRKTKRLAERLGAPAIADSKAETLSEGLDSFMRWHRQSAGAKGRFMAPGMELFFRRLGEEFLSDGTFRLSFLEVDGTRLAGTIGFRDGRRFLLYNSAYDHDRRAIAPGIVMVAELVRDAIASGCEAIDFLHGDLEYKYRFGARPRRLLRLQLERR
ncbi:MAG TPA: GNAT family N-acetyltransferase [Actinomycetota bacterium]|nr:GNAT family N-acetyltransferase [Actinomycetota bacterium]